MSIENQLSVGQILSGKPVREGLFLIDPPALLGSTCGICGTSMFPSRDFCPACSADGPLSVRPLARYGSVFSYTVVHQAPGGRRTPYVLGYVDLDDDEVRVLAQIDVSFEQIDVGMRVALVLREAGQSDGASILNFAFAPVPVYKERQQ